MCTICQTFNPQKEACEYESVPVMPHEMVLASLVEGVDATSGTNTPYTIAVGDTFNGYLSVYDTDWVALNVVEGETYSISLSSFGAGDALLRLYDGSGNYIGYNDDSGPGTGAYANFTADYTGTVYLSAAEYNLNSMSYQLSVSAGTAYTEFTLDQIATQLTNTFWGGSQRKHDVSAGDTLTVNITGLTADGQQLARWAFEAWTAVTGIQFEEVTASAAITFDDAASGAYASSVTSNGTIFSSEINISTAWLSSYGTTIDSYSFQTYMHEIGHALGLGHGGNYNGSADYGVDSYYRNDSWQDTVMSYFSQSENYNINASYAYTASLMAADIVAIQNLYGTNVATEEGDTVYGANSTVSGYLGDLFKQAFGEAYSNTSVYTGNAVAITVYDTGGTDTFDFSPVTTDQVINLNQEMQSSVNGGVGNLTVARGTVIENAIGGQGNDLITGNDANNVLTGGAGNDTLIGGLGENELHGGDDDDTATLGNFNASTNEEMFAGSFDGGAGTDGLFLNGDYSDYNIVETNGTYSFYHNGYNDVAGLGRLIATATNIELFQGQALTTVVVPPTTSKTPTELFNERVTAATGTAPTDLTFIRDYDGNDLGGASDWKLIGQVDIEFDGDVEYIYVNQTIGRWATIGPDSTGAIDFSNHGLDGDTRVVGIYIDPNVEDGSVVRGSALDSQRRFSNDLRIDNLTVIDAFDFDGDGYQEIYFKVNDGTAYLRALMHDDGNIQYANYQNAQQVEDYLTGLGYDQTVLDTILI